MPMKVYLSKFRKIWDFFINKNGMEEKTPTILGVNKFMCKACELAKVVTNECYERKYSISAAKLQKLLVLMHGEHLATYDKRLFSEDVVCWKCGVAIKEVEIKFLLHDFSKKDKLPIHIAILKTEEDVIENVLNEYGDLDILELNKDIRLTELTSLHPYKDGEKVIIPNESIKKVFLNYGKKI